MLVRGANAATFYASCLRKERSRKLNSKSVLAIGIDPAFADLSAHPDLSVDLVRAYVDQQIDRVRDLGYEVDSCLIDQG